ncbi:MAG: hypothetical protein WDO24_25565 [Pseudomonadota bacterium]
MTVIDSRAAAVHETVVQIRQIERSQGVTPASIEAMKAALIALASRTELFPPRAFPDLERHRQRLSPVRGQGPAVRALRLGGRAGQGRAAAQPHPPGR